MGASSRQLSSRLMGCVISAAARASRCGLRACWAPLSVWQIGPGARGAGRRTRGAGARSPWPAPDPDPGSSASSATQAVGAVQALAHRPGLRSCGCGDRGSPRGGASPRPCARRARPREGRGRIARPDPGSGPDQARGRLWSGAADAKVRPIRSGAIGCPCRPWVARARSSHPQQPPAAGRAAPAGPRAAAARDAQRRMSPQRPVRAPALGVGPGRMAPSRARSALALVPWPLCPGPCALALVLPGRDRRARGPADRHAEHAAHDKDRPGAAMLTLEPEPRRVAASPGRARPCARCRAPSRAARPRAAAARPRPRDRQARGPPSLAPPRVAAASSCQARPASGSSASAPSRAAPTRSPPRRASSRTSRTRSTASHRARLGELPPPSLTRHPGLLPGPHTHLESVHPSGGGSAPSQRRSSASSRPRSSAAEGPGATLRPSSPPPSNGSTGSTIAGSSARSATSHPPKPRCATASWRTPPWPRRTPNEIASGKDAAVHEPPHRAPWGAGTRHGRRDRRSPRRSDADPERRSRQPPSRRRRAAPRAARRRRSRRPVPARRSASPASRRRRTPLRPHGSGQGRPRTPAGARDGTGPSPIRLQIGRPARKVRLLSSRPPPTRPVTDVRVEVGGRMSHRQSPVGRAGRP